MTSIRKPHPSLARMRQDHNRHARHQTRRVPSRSLVISEIIEFSAPKLDARENGKGEWRLLCADERQYVVCHLGEIGVIRQSLQGEIFWVLRAAEFSFPRGVRLHACFSLFFAYNADVFAAFLDFSVLSKQNVVGRVGKCYMGKVENF